MLVIGALLLLLPARRAGAQSGRKRAAQPTATPRQPATQRPRRASPASTETTTKPVRRPPPLPVAPVNLPMTEAPPPWPSPSPSPAQTGVPPAATAGAATQAGDEVDEADVVRINSNLVTVPASVVDDRGRAVVDLKLEDFELRVDGQPREISELGHSETPVRIVLLFDNSMSLAAAREFEKKAAIKFFRTVMRPIDQAAIYSIWTIPIFVQPLTSDVRTLVRTIERFGTPEDGATALFDTVAQAADYLRSYQDRKVIIIVSDGADTLSNMDFLTSLKRVMTADVQVYAVQTGQLENANLYNLSAHHRLQEYASQTGGAVYVPRGTTDLDTAFAQISADLSQQYVLSYYPQDARQDGRFRTIGLRIKSRPNMRVRARKGYYDRPGQKQAFVPVENATPIVNQPSGVRSAPSDEVERAVASARVERRELTQAKSTAPAATRRTTPIGNAMGPPGPDDEPERTGGRTENATGRNTVETPPPGPDTTASTSARTTPTPQPTPQSTSKPESTSKPAPATRPSSSPPSAQTRQAEKAQPSTQKRPLTGGVLNGKALSLPRPVYPPAAKSTGATGTVVVEVLIDESGKVISARAISGPQILQAASVQAARLAKFSPTKLSGEPVQVTGTIAYSFRP